MLRRSPPTIAPKKPHNVQKYCKFHEQNGHTMVEYCELKKAPHELVDKGQIDHFLNGSHTSFEKNESPHSPSRGMNSVQQKLWIPSRGLRRPSLKAHSKCSRLSKGLVEAPQFASPHNDLLVVKMKVASAIVRRILIDIGSSMDTITWDCLKKLTYPRRDIIPLVHPILAFGGQDVNPTSMIHLPLGFGDKLKARNLETDFLVVDVPTAYKVILGRPTLHRVKTVIVSRPQHPGGWSPRLPSPSSEGPDPRPPPAGAHRHNGDRPRSSDPPKSLEPVSPRPCVSTYGVCMDLLIALLLSLGRPLSPRSCLSLSFRKCLFQLALQILVFDLPSIFLFLQLPQCRWYRATSPSGFQRSALTLTPRAKASAIVTSSSVTLRGFKVPEVAKSKDLTKSCISVNLAAGSALIKIGGNCRALMGVLPATCEVAPMGTRRFSGTRGLVTSRSALRAVRRSGLIVRLFPIMGKGESRRLILAAFNSLTLTNTTGGGTFSKENTLVKHRQWVIMNRGDKGLAMYLVVLLVHKALPLFFPAMLGFGHYLLRGGVRCLEGH
ncbi:LOW QUALITY PROTEIN: hypothetical protein Cgig2_006775 [Carnegiea gigantea]|uniref:Uncharacterized protein n=1 Tax=Carnegiea gigantea TaxID=171969 RepID=A0A9Q1JRT9_9CARY|nr:LOW QUALITY PROTEIN: hypothetical protein Cgig2_006775 [Carnegiea gigantea]